MWIRSLALAAMLLSAATAAQAATCEWMADEVDKAVMSPGVSEEVKKQIIALRDEAEDWGPREDDDFCQDPLIKAMGILGIKVE